MIRIKFDKSLIYGRGNKDTGNILGYFTLTHKSLILNGHNLSRTARKKLARYSRLDSSTGNYMASAFLLAQFGKNYTLDKANRIDGSELMQLATGVLLHVQHQIGGGIVYLDCEDNEHLTSFYSKQNFKVFDDRYSSSDKQNFVQFIRFF